MSLSDAEESSNNDNKEECWIPPPGSVHRFTSEETKDSPDLQRSIASVEERLLSFYNHQLEHEHEQHHHVERKPQTQEDVLAIHKPHAYPCQTTHKRLPSPPSQWPQCPVMLRPSPNTFTKIRGIRHSNKKEYQHYKGFCAGCILPINTGKERPGESLVIDFETKHFVGTVLMRIKDIPSATTLKENNNHDESYFHGKKRRFQAVVKGKFKTRLKMSQCVTGQVFDRPAGSLPAKWIVTSFIKFVSTLAPQLQASIDGDEPRFLTPLVATAHTVLEKPSNNSMSSVSLVDENETCSLQQDNDDEDNERLLNFMLYAGSQDIEQYIEEPPANDDTSIMKHVAGANATFDTTTTVSKRQKIRKKAFNQIAAKHEEEPRFQLDKEYSFEFYQHLILFAGDSLAIDMGRPIGNVDLANITNGQPIKFMSAHQNAESGELEELWSFDIWHESLFPYAQAAEEEME